MAHHLCPVYLFLFAFALFSRAHEVGLSVLTLEVGGSPAISTFLIAPADADHAFALDENLDEVISLAEFESKKNLFGEFAQESWEFLSSGTPFKKQTLAVDWPDPSTIRIQNEVLILSSPFTIRSDWLEHLPEKHRHLVMITRDGVPLMTGFLERGSPELQVDLGHEGRATLSLGSFFIHGLEHILAGLDHVLFVLALLMTGPSLMNLFKVITSFTVAHSVTLALAVLDLVRVSPLLVEPAIALSIVFVAIQNMRGKRENLRWLLAGGFGLIHGLGFASASVELFSGLPRSAIVPPLAVFNLGIEAGQILIAVVVVPLVWKLKQKPFYKAKVLPAGSAIIALVALYWFFERII